MRVLGIESSCDETALALVSDAGQEGAVMSTQVDVHALFGGVVPELASREHCRLIRPLLDRLLSTSGKCLDDVDAVAVARGPGLLGSLLVGMAFAKGLALGRSLPLIGVNHLHAHLLVAGLEAQIIYPALGVLVSGGHTHLYRMESPSCMTVLGKTLDDAAGEACDKFAKMAGLPYPGGALLDALAQTGNPHAVPFPRPYTQKESLDFSFSGLKTAAAMVMAEHPEWRFPTGQAPAKDRLEQAPEALRHAAASYLQAVADTLAIKTRLALRQFEPGCIVLAGGVAANTFVRRELGTVAAEAALPLLVPRPALCTDNGVMIAHAGRLLALQGLAHDLSLAAIPRGRAIPHDYVPLHMA